MGLDTIFFAIVAVVLLARLWTVLGRRNEEDKEHSNSFFSPPRFTKPEEDPRPAELAKPSEALRVFRALNLAPTSLAGYLQQIKDLDPAFDEKQFLRDVRQSFSSILDAFAKGDLLPVTRLLGPAVVTQFQQAIDARKAAGQVMENKIISVKDVETKAAHVEGTKAVIAVRFVTVQENILRDALGRVIGGEAGKAEEITDVWSFARDTKSSDPGWQLVETHA